MIDIAIPEGVVSADSAFSVAAALTPSRSFSAGSARSWFRAAAPSPVTPTERLQSVAIFSAVARSEDGMTLARGPGVPGDCKIARWKSSRDIGETRCASTEPPPAASPKMVTWCGSPPKTATLLLTHCRAAS
jgi:hypothetical protein